ncbi:NDP-hexose 2,3-dehydratase family protein [Micromonospora auratinigra]|uniref:Oxidase EvaA n=1 Tax=Micromonospora auratinigra TaxID=261654 RepID=A0A1A8ZIJ8_9ACTN|nr:NDP-hexose 2,3-dehydratase family protein [Micromonospora auratinigra]SBT43666.1 oxidase EvaA [Micromonospora auratinigra]
MSAADLAERIARSARQRTEGAEVRTADVLDWLGDRRRSNGFRVEPVPFDAQEDWSFDPVTGNLRHRSGGFFAIEGLRATVDDDPAARWEQPVLRQPEIGILGLLAKDIDGVLHLLVQAKMEPGNPGLVQLSPTVQATRSNYLRVHRGARVRYVEHFTAEHRDTLVDVLQSEHGSWFYQKANRNMVVETTADVPAHEDFRWLTVGQLGELLRHDNVVNMDARSILACLGAATTPDPELLFWITAERSRRRLATERIPLSEVGGWVREADRITRPDGRFFRVETVRVEAGNREVRSWHQPLFAPVNRGVCAFLTRRAPAGPQVLAAARVEGGFRDTVELGPTVQCQPDSHPVPPPFLAAVLGAAPDRICYEAVHAEEGGRFRDAESRYLFVEAPDDVAAAEPPPGFRWVAPERLSALLWHGNYVNVQARTLLACLTTGAAEVW